MLDAAVVFHRMFYTLGAGSCCVVCMQRYYVVCFFLVVFFFFCLSRMPTFPSQVCVGLLQTPRFNVCIRFLGTTAPGEGIVDRSVHGMGLIARLFRLYVIFVKAKTILYYMVSSTCRLILFGYFFLYFLFFSFIVVSIIISAATDGAKSYRQWAEIHVSFMVCCFFFFGEFIFSVAEIGAKVKGSLTLNVLAVCLRRNAGL